MALLLLAGSVGLKAQTSDPFPSVNGHNYIGNIPMSVKAVMNGQALTYDVVIAVYCGDQIRGKGSPNDASAPGVAYLTVYGDATVEKLYFKVYHDGAITEVDQGDVSYRFNGNVGTPDAPYILNVPSPTVETTFSAEGWATTCLSFNACVPPGVTVWNATAIEDSELKMEIVNTTVLPKDMPVLLQGTSGMTTCKWGVSVADAEKTVAIRPQSSILVGATEEEPVTAKTVLTLGHSKESNEIGFWLFTGTTIPANRAYIADFPAGTRGVTWTTDNTTHIVPVDGPVDVPVNSPVYNLNGQKMNGRLRPGCYIKDGKKFLVR